jgi:hypothetical protein
VVVKVEGRVLLVTGRGMIWYDIIYGMVRCGMVWYSMVWYAMVWNGMIW